MDIRRILCPIDLAEASLRALRHAVRIAQAYGAEIDALHVAPLVSSASEMNAVLRAIEEAGVSAHGHVSTGDPAREITAHAKAHDVDLIVLGTHGREGVRRLIAGSVAETVIRQAGRPVITVPRAAGEPAAEGVFRRILCPIDFSPLSKRALRLALSLSGSGQVVVLHVIEPLPPREVKGRIRRTPAGHERFIEAQMKAQLEDIGSNPGADLRGLRRLVRSGPVSREILATAADIGADLIVMGIHGRSALDVMLSGSATNDVVRRAGCPVLTVGAPGGGEHGLVPARRGADRLLDLFDRRPRYGWGHRARL